MSLRVRCSCATVAAMSSRDRSPAPSIDSMQLEDVELGEKGSEEKRHDRPIVRSFLTNEKGRRVKLKRRSSLENFGRLGLLTPALALTPNVDEVMRTIVCSMVWMRWTSYAAV